MKLSSSFYFLLFCGFLAVSVTTHTQAKQVSTKANIVVGAAQFDQYLPLLKNKKVGLVVNQTSQISQQHLVDVLLSKQITVSIIFAPEHGFRGDHDAGAAIANSVDQKTGVAVHSIYGKNKKPSADVMAALDVILFDIQDVGVRFYTYISSMHYMMLAAAEAGIPFIVLDRPNPNIAFVDGPILDKKFSSFVGMHPIPVLHGMTVGELAQMINGEGWLNSKNTLSLTVIPVANYTRHDKYALPVKPSPNLPNDHAISLYPSLCFFEATPVSIGRGTDFPFQVIGHDKISIGDFTFTPRSIVGAAAHPKLENKKLTGQDLRNTTISGLDLSYFIQWYQVFEKSDEEFFQSPDFMDKLAGTDQVRMAILAGKSATEISAMWQNDVQQFLTARKPYLLYAD